MARWGTETVDTALNIRKAGWIKIKITIRIKDATAPKGNHSRLLEPCLPFTVFHRVNLLWNEVRCPYWNEPDPMDFLVFLRALRG